jgi:ABC-2 type transport system ATP-binding protein
MMLVIENLVKKFGKFRALDGLSFEIEEGSIYGFVGANGAGKTTTMKIVAGLLEATSGRVILDGADISQNPNEVKKKIGYMPDFFGVYNDLKVNEYMDFYAGVHGVPRNEREKISEQLIELVNLSDKKHSYVDVLSRGMKQRLCLARSLIHNPRLLILDEPASGLDPKARVEMKEILKELCGMGKTILISSHILSELSEICTSIGIIEKGRMIASGSVDEIVKKASCNKTIRVSVLGDLNPAVKFLREQPSIGDITTANGYLDADYKGDNKDMAEMLKNMIKNGIPVVSFAETEKNLESAFINIIWGGNNENEDKPHN